MNKIFTSILFLFLSVIVFADNNLLYNISGASSNANNYLLKHSAYTLSYNNTNCEANWVAWHLEKSDLGSVKKSDKFIPDPALPSSFCKATTEDYTNSNYTRGHLCPSGDRTSTYELNQETFYMSNIEPQTSELNQKVWNNFEIYLRDLASNSGKEIYLYSGGIGGINKINNKVLIPSSFFKVAIILPVGDNDYNRLNEADIICILVPNKTGLSTNWKDYTVDITKIEQQTGFNFSFLKRSLLRGIGRFN